MAICSQDVFSIRKECARAMGVDGCKTKTPPDFRREKVSLFNFVWRWRKWTSDKKCKVFFTLFSGVEK